MKSPGFLERLERRLTNWRINHKVPKDSFAFVRHNRKKWPDRSKREGVILIGMIPSKPGSFCYSYVTNYLADKYDARIACCDFVETPNPVTRLVYESFGAKFALGHRDALRYAEQAAEHAKKVFDGLSCKADVLKIKVDGLVVGDQIYNSYLRFHNMPTVDLKDLRLLKVIEQAFQIASACREYLQKNRVHAFFTDDFSYIGIGILTRLMFEAGVPIYLSLFGNPYWIMQIDPEHSGDGHGYPPPVGYRYYKYPSVFATLAPEKQKLGLSTGRKLLEKRLSGAFDPKVNMPESTYAASNQRILGDSDRPRILIMLHDFIDSPHSYRHNLFPDFLEWITYLLERAVQTPFDWYVKPHPFSVYSSRRAIDSANARVIEELKAKYPGVTFLPPGTSNAQILKDGISAMFTVYGTAGHEFAFRGVSVVNCGDNPHIAYNFNIHARSLEEYDSYIRNADRLQISIDPRQIEEFVYMHYFHVQERDGAPVNPIVESLISDPDWNERLNEPGSFFQMLEGMNPKRENAFRDYLKTYFNSPR